MRRYILVGLLIFICFLLQSTVFQSLDFGGIVPNLLIVLTASFGFMSGDVAGLIIGFICGLLCDIFFGSYLGVYSLLFLLFGGFGGVMARFFYQDDIVFPYLTVALSDGLFGVICYIFMFLLRGRFSFGVYISQVILPEMLYTLILSLLLIPLLHKFNSFLVKLEVKEKESDVSGNT